MFTGIITHTGRLTSIEDFPGGKELEIACSFAGDTHLDESISVNGTCLTVVKKTDEFFYVQCVEETLGKTTLGNLDVGQHLNLERSLTLAQGIEGHIVQGHVDTVGVIEKIETGNDGRLLTISYPEAFINYVVGRGSIAVDGISLTVARVTGNKLIVAIIPYTWDHTNLTDRSAGDRVNLEFDIFGKYVIRYMENSSS